MTVSEIILNQLGGIGKLRMMIGLKQIISEDYGVSVIFPKPKHKGAVNKVRVKLLGLTTGLLNIKSDRLAMSMMDSVDRYKY